MKKASSGSKKGEAEAEEHKGPSKPVSLAPLTFDEALDGLLGVKPEPKGEAREMKKRAVKKTAKK